MICSRVVMIVIFLGYIEHPGSMLVRQYPDGIVLILQLCVCSDGVTPFLGTIYCYSKWAFCCLSSGEYRPPSLFYKVHVSLI
ncbi:hypothetical protein Hanom_Chr13g01198501 [Helianthus anomalus]